MQGRRGLTLIEVLVAFAILALLVAVVQAAFTAGLRGWTKSDYVVQAGAIARLALDQMSREIGSMVGEGTSPYFYCLGLDGGSGAARLRSNSTGHEFYFIAPLNPGEGQQSDLCEVGYWCDGRNTPRLDDDRLNRFYVTDDRAESGSNNFDFNFATGTSNELVPQVTDLRFTYIDRSGATFSSWDSRLRGGPPRRIQISITVMVGRGSPETNPDFYTGTFTTSVFMPHGV